MTRLLVWYDSGCPLCRREIAPMRRLDRGRAIEFIDVGTVERAGHFARAELRARFHAREGDVVLAGAVAFAAWWRAIPLLRPLGLAARNRSVLAALERLHRAFPRLRPRLQHLAARFDA